MRLINTTVHSLTWLFYKACQTLPSRFRWWLVRHLPSWPDSFEPASFFMDQPALPPEADYIPYDPAPLNMLVLVKQCIIVGNVTLVETRPKDATWNHETFRLQPLKMGYLNPFSMHVGCTVECEPRVGSPLPKVGDKVMVYGSYGINLANGWPEIHWCTFWRVVK